MLRIIYLVVLAGICPALSWEPTQCGKANQITEWGKNLDPKNVLQEYPRPQLVRGDNSWKNLNGIWEFQPATPGDQPPFGKKLASEILVPFPVESCLSGIGENYKYLWYRLLFDQPSSFKLATTLLHFGAVDWQCKIWLNQKLVGNHTGGYDPFYFDITKNLKSSDNELIVYVYDPSDEGDQPHGKQKISRIDNPGGDTYTPSSGIWQTVFLENVPTTHIDHIRIDTDTKQATITTVVAPGTKPTPGVLYVGTYLPNMPIRLRENNLFRCADLCANNSECSAWTFADAQCDAVGTPRCWLLTGAFTTVENSCRVSATIGPKTSVKYSITDGTNVVATATGSSNEPVTIKINNPKLWSPSSPFLYNVTVQINGDAIDSYFGLRTFTLGHYNHSGLNDTGVESHRDRFGHNMEGSPFKLASANPEICHQKCQSTKGCVAWSYAVPGCDKIYADPTCWLQDTISYFEKDPCRDSGSLATGPFPARRPLLNGEWLYLAGWLDQSFWPDGQYTAPSDEALAFDLRQVKRFGLNMVRLHQKVNSQRWYWYADKLGVVLFQDAVQKYGGATKALIPYFYDDIQKMMIGLHNHPSIIQWTVFNERDDYAVFNVSSTVDMAKRLDPSRLVDANSGGPANNLNLADVNDVHTYPYPGKPVPSATQYAMVGEYGGVGAFVEGKEWVAGKCHTYLKANTTQEEADIYIKMVDTIKANRETVSAVVYTQITDVELECDGFLNYDRTDKFDASTLAKVVAANKALISG